MIYIGNYDKISPQIIRSKLDDIICYNIINDELIRTEIILDNNCFYINYPWHYDEYVEKIYKIIYTNKIYYYNGNYYNEIEIYSNNFRYYTLYRLIYSYKEKTNLVKYNEIILNDNNKENKMKDSISLRELFEEKACIDSIKYFIKCIEVFEIYNKNSDNNLYNQQYTIDSVIKVLKHHDQYFFDDINVNEYFNWLKNNGYKIEDNEDIKNQINELKSKITSLENKLL